MTEVHAISSNRSAIANQTEDNNTNCSDKPIALNENLKKSIKKDKEAKSKSLKRLWLSMKFFNLASTLCKID